MANSHLNPMASAHALALQGRWRVPPNPAVGCVITSPDGLHILGQGHTQAVGQPHAEIMALRDAAARKHDVRGATAYVTLEPCSHHGRTPPCSQALIAAGMGRVVIAMLDPNPLVNGRGAAQLRQAHVAVEVLPQDSPEAQATRELNIGFFNRMVRGTPWVRLKVAASLDGKTALENGVSQWITSEPSRMDTHAWRARACAVLTGVGTVLQDNPRLDARLVAHVPRQPHLVLLDSQLNTPLDAALWQPVAPRQVWIYTASHDARRRAALEAVGATVTVLPAAQAGASSQPRVDLVATLRDLARREVNELHVEAGARLNGALVREGLVNELLVYLAPRLLGAGRDMAQWGPLAALSDSLPLKFQDIQAIGPDIRLLARVC